MPTLRRLSDADPAALMAAMETVWADGDAAVVLPPDVPDAAVPASVAAALAGHLEPPDGTALIVATSGSTGAPRAVVLSHDAVRWAVAATLDRLDCRAGERWALALPARHVAGLMVLLRSAVLGAPAAVVADPGDPHALAAAAPTAHHIALVPTQLVRALDAEVDLARFSTVLVGGGPIGDGLIERAVAAGIRVITSYGMTETCGGCVHDGVPLEGIEVEVDPAGRIRLRGPAVAAQELNGTSIRDPDGWFTTADRGRLVNGRLEVIGRVDDVIISGGVNVDSTAVAEALRSHPAVVDAIALGVPNPAWGQAVRAVVAVRSEVDLSALRAHVAAHLGRTHAPRELLLVDFIPRDAMGKVSTAARDRLIAAPPTASYGTASKRRPTVPPPAMW